MPARILLIEDNTDNLELMTYLLKSFGFTVLTAQDGEEGLEAARHNLPDLILCDLQMPKVDGYEVARQLRRDPRFAKRPLVAVTAYAMRGDRDKVLSAGFDGYISKPITPEEFVTQVSAFLATNQHATHAPAAPANGSQPAQCRARILVVDNSHVNLSLMQSTLEPFGYKVIPVSSVREALVVARESPPDLILSDLHMPEANGYDFLKLAKADPNLRSVPFAMVSSTVWRDVDPQTALNLGASKFILRPIDPEDLVAEVEECLVESRRQKSEVRIQKTGGSAAGKTAPAA